MTKRTLDTLLLRALASAAGAPDAVAALLRRLTDPRDCAYIISAYKRAKTVDFGAWSRGE